MDKKSTGYPSDMFLRKMQIQNELLYLAVSMQETIDSGKLSGKKLHEASRKREIIMTAADFVNECFYKMEALHRALSDANFNLVHEKQKAQKGEEAEKQLDAVRQAWEDL